MNSEDLQLPDLPVVTLVDGLGSSRRQGLSVPELAARLRGMMQAEGFNLVAEDAPSWLRVAWGTGTPSGSVAQTGDRDGARHLLESLQTRVALAAAWGDPAPVLELLSVARSRMLEVLKVHVVPVPSAFAVDLFGLRAWLYGQAILSVARRVSRRPRPLAGQWRVVAEGAVRVVIAAAEPTATSWRPAPMAPLVVAADSILCSPAWRDVVAGEASRDALAADLLHAVAALPPSERPHLDVTSALAANVHGPAAMAAGRRGGAVVDLLPQTSASEPVRVHQTANGGVWAVADAPAIGVFLGAALHGALPCDRSQEP